MATATAEAPAKDETATAEDHGANQQSVLSKEEHIQQILDADRKHREAKQTCKNLESDIQDLLEDMESYQAYKKAVEAFDAAKENLRIACLSNGQLNNQKEALAEEKANRKLRKDILSGLLVRYAADFHVRSVRTDEDIDDTYREIKLVGTMGKKLKEQVELAL